LTAPKRTVFIFADAATALSQKTLTRRKKISAGRSEQGSNWLLLAGCQEQNFHYITLSGFCQEKIEEKIKKSFFHKMLDKSLSMWYTIGVKGR
jgi:hypothetical protein